MTEVTKHLIKHDDNELEFQTKPEKDFWKDNTLHGGNNVII